MSAAAALGATEQRSGAGRLAENVMHFARALRAAGMPVGPGQVIDALAMLEVVGCERRDDWYWTLATLFVRKREHRELFDQAFAIFWRDPALLERMMGMMLPKIQGRGGQAQDADIARRLADALAPNSPQFKQRQDPRQSVELDVQISFSEREKLQQADFEKMSGEEWRAAQKLIANMRLPVPDVPTRRFDTAARGRVDPRRSLRQAARGAIELSYRRRRVKPPPIVVIADISGSMHRYTRMLLYFVHALARTRGRVHTLLFGTRLTNITRLLRQRDVDLAVDAVVNSVQDWAGGTRIGAALDEFNRRWARRLLGQNATVLLITDGLDRDDAGALAAAAERLALSCKQLLWLNPLLRYQRFEPRAAGVRALLPHVDAHLPVHNLDSLADLSNALTRARFERPKLH